MPACRGLRCSDDLAKGLKALFNVEGGLAPDNAEDITGQGGVFPAEGKPLLKAQQALIADRGLFEAGVRRIIGALARAGRVLRELQGDERDRRRHPRPWMSASIARAQSLP